MDAYNNVATSFNSAVTVGLAGGTSNLTGTVTTDATNGVAMFNDLMSTTSGSISLVASSSTTSSSQPTSSIPVTAASPSQLVIETQPSQQATAGQAFMTQPVVYEEDAYGNLVTSDSTTVVTAYLTSGSGTLVGTMTATLSGGIATFTNLADDTAQTATLSFSGNGFTSAASDPIVVSPAGASKLVITQEPSTSAVTHEAFSTQPVVDEEDKYGNVETGDNSTVLTATIASGTGELANGTAITLQGGVGAYTDLEDTSIGTITLEFSGGGLSTGATVPIVVSPGPADKLVIATEPSETAAAGVAFTTEPVIDEEDQYGNVITSDNSTVVTVYPASGSGPFSGPTSLTLTGGVATFTGLAADTVGTITLGFSGGGFNSPASVPIVVSPGPAAKLVVQTQPSPEATAGQAFTVQPVIYEEDQFGNLETTDDGTTVTVTLNSGTGPLVGTTALTTIGGIVSFAGLTDDTAETIVLKFSATGLPSVLSNSITVSPAQASQLVIHSQPSSAAAAGVALATQPVVYEEDKYHNIETGDSSTMVTVALASGAGPLQGTTEISLKNGVASFTNLSDDLAETITLSFSGGGFSTGPSDAVLVKPGTPGKLLIQTQPSTSTTAGQVLTTQPVIYEEDQYGNLENDDSSTVVTAIGASSSVQVSGGTSITLVDGYGTFTSLAVNTAGSVAVEFTGAGITSPATTSIAVSAASASKLVIQTAPLTTATAGQALAVAPIVYEEDNYGNLETADNSTTVTLTLNSGTGPVLATSVVKGGIAIFGGLTQDTAGPITLDFSATGLASALSAPITIIPATPAQLVIHTQPSNTVEAGTVLPTQPVLYLEDKYNNLETTDNSTVVSLSLASGTGPLEGATSVIVKGGVATFTNLVDTAPETLTLKFTTGSLTATANPINVTQAPATQLVVTTQPPSSLTLGQTFTLVVAAEDALHNIVKTFTGGVTISLANDPTLTELVYAQNGIATFTGLSVPASVSGESIEASATGLLSTYTNPLPPLPPPPPPPPPPNSHMTPTIISAQPNLTRKTNKKGKPTGKPVFSGFTIGYSVAMNSANAGVNSNYHVFSETVKKVKKKNVITYKPVTVTVTYSPSTDSVSLNLSSNKPFAKGGEIMISGVTSQAGVASSAADTTLNISPNAKGITIA